MALAYLGAESLFLSERHGLLWELLGFGALFGAALGLAFQKALELEVLVSSAALGFGAGYFLPWSGILCILVLATRRLFIPKENGRNVLGKGFSLCAFLIGLVLFLKRAGWLDWPLD